RLRAREAEALLRRAVELADVEVPVGDERDVGRGGEHDLGERLRALTHVRDAHGQLGLALIDGDGLLAAGVVAAHASVELLLGRLLAGLAQDRADDLLAGQVLALAAVGEGLVHAQALGRGRVVGAGAARAVHDAQAALKAAVRVLAAGRAAGAPADT